MVRVLPYLHYFHYKVFILQGMDCLLPFNSSQQQVAMLGPSKPNRTGLFCAIQSSSQSRTILNTSITTINNNVRPRGKGARVRSQVQVDALELPRVRVPPHGRLLVPGLLELRGAVVRDGRVDVSGTDAVDSGKVYPFHRQGLGEVNHAGFAGIVTCLEVLSLAF